MYIGIGNSSEILHTHGWVLIFVLIWFPEVIKIVGFICWLQNPDEIIFKFLIINISLSFLSWTSSEDGLNVFALNGFRIDRG